MRTIVFALYVGIAVAPVPLVAALQVPRDTPPPAIENARRERALRAAVADGTATKDTYLELAGLLNRQGRLAETIEAIRGAAALEPDSPDAQHRLATFLWEAAQKNPGLDAATRQAYIRDGIAAEDRALTLKPDYMEALTYKNILLRMQANLSSDPIERSRLIAEADALRNRVLEMQRQRGPDVRTGPEPPPPPPPPFSGFPESYDLTAARLTPVRVGDNVRQPTKIADVKPVYPADARAAGAQGVVIIEAIIDESGSIANARILRSIPLLDDAAMGAVSQWRFTPTKLNGAPVNVIMTVTVNFTLQH